MAGDGSSASDGLYPDPFRGDGYTPFHHPARSYANACPEPSRRENGYLLKPVELDEVRQAVQEALARRERLARSEGADEEERPLQQGSFSVDLKKHLATVDGRPLDLTPNEFTEDAFRFAHC